MRIVVHAFADFDPVVHCADLGLDIVVTSDLAEIVALAPGAEVLVLIGQSYSEALAEAVARPGSRLRFIQFLSAGYEQAETFGVPPGVLLSNGSTIWAPMVAEHAVTMLLGLLRRLPQLERRRLAHAWARTAQVAEQRSLEGARVGILGYGTIGREIARRMAPFGTEIIGISRSATACPHATHMIAPAQLDALLPELDALINVVPAGPETTKIIGPALLARLRPDAVVINMGRGATTDEAALVAWLKANPRAGAGLDVYETEPLPADSPLWSLDNVMMSPHCAGFGSPLTMRRANELFRDNVIALRDGKPLRNQVFLAA